MDRIVPIEKVETKNALSVSIRTLKALKKAYEEDVGLPYDDLGLIGLDLEFIKEKNCCCISQKGTLNIYCYEGRLNHPLFRKFADNCDSCYKSRKEEFVFKPSWIK